ncbi:MAG: hypothetical protein EOP49_16740 [Sphingobacteriales bacterium]|nr:MAG: hypothetical protein EOP49_16740 [Sphingobacteriales bacterium]
MKTLLAFLLVSCLFHNPALAQTRSSVFSPEVRDSFAIYITIISRMDTSKPVRYFYYLDAGIKSGAELRRQVSGLDPALTENKVFVGIAHMGNFHQKRRRDFIPPHAAIADERADLFYAFLVKTLIPGIEAKYGAAASRSLMGHSFGGLFVFYSMLREDRVFTKFFSLSPSLWVNRYAVFEQETSVHDRTESLPVFLYLSAGTAEKLNDILEGARRMKARLGERNYRGLRFAYEEHAGKGHNSQVPRSIGALLLFPD